VHRLVTKEVTEGFALGWAEGLKVEIKADMALVRRPLWLGAGHTPQQ
jgi:hypothetical protein